MRTLALSLSAIFLAGMANAQDGLRETDTLLSGDAMSALISGQVIEFFDGSKSTYASDGGYGYTYTDDGPVWRGTYEVTGQSEVCVEFENGSSRCDLFIKDGDRTVLITADGLRFPVRNITVHTN